MVHDSVGNYILPLNHSVLVLSDRCQIGCHGEACERICGGRDSRRHHVLRLGSLICLRSAARLGTGQTGEPRGNLGSWDLEFE